MTDRTSYLLSLLSEADSTANSIATDMLWQRATGRKLWHSADPAMVLQHIRDTYHLLTLGDERGLSDRLEFRSAEKMIESLVEML